jgi:hypothetical protein
MKKRYTISMKPFLAVFVSTLIVATSADAATIYIDPVSNAYGPGDTFIASVRIDTDGECINATNVEISYPTDKLRAVDFSRGGSILSLWIEEPQLDTENGTVKFAGGVPGGYCGRIQGDPVISNVLGRIVFSVVQGPQGGARVRLLPETRAYLNDGLGTEVSLSGQDALYTIGQNATLPENEWLTQVGADEIPPDSFDVLIDSTRGVFGGKYYIVFSTVDKQSGLDHYEIFERGAWKRVESPYQLRDQSLRNPVEVKAIDKAGNERLGDFDPTTIPERKSAPRDYVLILFVLAVPILAGIWRWHRSRNERDTIVSPPPQA